MTRGSGRRDIDERFDYEDCLVEELVDYIENAAAEYARHFQHKLECDLETMIRGEESRRRRDGREFDKYCSSELMVHIVDLVKFKNSLEVNIKQKAITRFQNQYSFLNRR